jgi:iron-sulfur cluster repair protein YtfE (RIC family)
VDSPRKKSSKTQSINETLDDLSDVIRKVNKCHGPGDSYEEEIAQVKQILEDNGYNEEDVVFMQVLKSLLE